MAQGGSSNPWNTYSPTRGPAGTQGPSQSPPGPSVTMPGTYPPPGGYGNVNPWSTNPGNRGPAGVWGPSASPSGPSVTMPGTFPGSPPMASGDPYQSFAPPTPTFDPNAGKIGYAGPGTMNLSATTPGGVAPGDPGNMTATQMGQPQAAAGRSTPNFVWDGTGPKPDWNNMGFDPNSVDGRRAAAHFRYWAQNPMQNEANQQSMQQSLSGLYNSLPQRFFK